MEVRNVLSVSDILLGLVDGTRTNRGTRFFDTVSIRVMFHVLFRILFLFELRPFAFFLQVSSISKQGRKTVTRFVNKFNNVCE